LIAFRETKNPPSWRVFLVPALLVMQQAGIQ
jgi:hypothetical protein